MDLWVDLLILIHDVACHHQLPGGEGPAVDLMQAENARELLEEKLFKQCNLNISWDCLKKNKTRLLDYGDTGPDQEHNVDHADDWVQVSGVVICDYLIVDQATS